MNRLAILNYLATNYDEWPTTLPMKEPERVNGGWTRVNGEIIFRINSTLNRTPEPINEKNWRDYKNSKHWDRKKILNTLSKNLKHWPDAPNKTWMTAHLLKHVGWYWDLKQDGSYVLSNINQKYTPVTQECYELFKSAATIDNPMTREQALDYLILNVPTWPTNVPLSTEKVNGWEWYLSVGGVVFKRAYKLGEALSSENLTITYDCWAQKSLELKKEASSSIIQYFNYEHLPEHLQKISKSICELATLMDSSLPNGPEKSTGLRKLLEAKDCFVRASL